MKVLLKVAYKGHGLVEKISVRDFVFDNIYPFPLVMLIYFVDR